MWYLELSIDNGSQYETVFCGLFNNKHDAEKKSKSTFSHLKILKFIEVVSNNDNSPKEE